MPSRLWVLGSNLRARRMDDGEADAPGRFEDRYNGLPGNGLGTFEPALNEVVVPNVNEDEGALLHGKGKLDFPADEVLLAAGNAFRCAILEIADREG